MKYPFALIHIPCIDTPPIMMNVSRCQTHFAIFLVAFCLYFFALYLDKVCETLPLEYLIVAIALHLQYRGPLVALSVNNHVIVYLNQSTT